MHILRVPLSDASEDAYVLINASSNGPSPLDLKLLATEGTAPYIATSKNPPPSTSPPNLTDQSSKTLPHLQTPLKTQPPNPHRLVNNPSILPLPT